MFKDKLRIGNWVRLDCSYESESPKLFRVEGININKARLVDVRGERINVEYGKIYPCKLDSSVFKINGFKPVAGWKPGTFECFQGDMKSVYICAFPIDDSMYYLEVENNVDNLYMKGRIRFVNEMQNLLCDCKVEKRIKLWKKEN